MDADRLCEESVKGIDELLERPVLARLISAERKRLLRAQREIWRDAGPELKAQLKRNYDAQPRRADDEPTPAPEDKA